MWGKILDTESVLPETSHCGPCPGPDRGGPGLRTRRRRHRRDVTLGQTRRTSRALNQLADPDIHRHLAAVLHHGHDADGNEFDRVAYNHDPAELHHELTAAGLHTVEARPVRSTPTWQSPTWALSLTPIVISVVRYRDR